MKTRPKEKKRRENKGSEKGEGKRKERKQKMEKQISRNGGPLICPETSLERNNLCRVLSETDLVYGSIAHTSHAALLH